MAFTFDYSLAGQQSTSYVPVQTYTSAEGVEIIGADDYFTYHPKQPDWEQLTVTEKEQFLVRATMRLDMERYGGNISDPNQRLQWPRQWIISRNWSQPQEMVQFADGNYFRTDNKMPLELEHATFELALYYIEEWKNQSSMVSKGDQERMESFSIGPLSATLRKASEAELPDTVKNLLMAIGPNGWSAGNKQPKLVR